MESYCLLNIKVIGQRSRSRVFCVWVTRQATRSYATTHSFGGASGGYVPVT